MNKYFNTIFFFLILNYNFAESMITDMSFPIRQNIHKELNDFQHNNRNIKFSYFAKDSLPYSKKIINKNIFFYVGFMHTKDNFTGFNYGITDYVPVFGYNCFVFGFRKFFCEKKYFFGVKSEIFNFFDLSEYDSYPLRMELGCFINNKKKWYLYVESELEIFNPISPIMLMPFNAPVFNISGIKRMYKKLSCSFDFGLFFFPDFENLGRVQYGKHSYYYVERFVVGYNLKFLIGFP